MEDYPSNSRHTKPEAEEPRETTETVDETVKKVVTGKVIQRKKPLGRKFLDFFGESDGSGVIDYVINEVLAPALRDMVIDAGTTAVERTFDRSGTRSSGRRTSSRRDRGDRDYVPYNRIREDRIRSRHDESRRPLSRQARRAHDFKEVVFETHREAYDVLEELRRKVDKVGTASVADFYIASGLDSEFTDDDWGWYYLDRARTTQCAGGYRLVLPRTEPLDDI